MKLQHKLNHVDDKDNKRLIKFEREIDDYNKE